VSETETHEQENPHAKVVLQAARAMTKASLLVTPPAVIVCIALFSILKGMPGFLGSLVGGVLAMLASLSTLGLMRFSAGQDPMFVMVIALGGYVVKVVLLFGALTLLKGVTALHPLSLGITMIVAILLAAAAEFAAFRKTKIPTIIPS
jgi:F0F1-type ATP synthase assembly protein I